MFFLRQLKVVVESVNLVSTYFEAADYQFRTDHVGADLDIFVSVQAAVLQIADEVDIAALDVCVVGITGDDNIFFQADVARGIAGTEKSALEE